MAEYRSRRAPKDQVGVTFSPAPPAPTVPTNPFALFDDPGTSYFLNQTQNQINRLRQPVSDPTTDAVMGLIASRIPGMLASGSASGGNALLGDLIGIGRQRMAELQQEPFSGAEENAMKVKAAEDVEELRTSSRQRAIEDASRRGLGKSSGVIQGALRTVDKNADMARAKGINDLMLAIAQERQRRKDQAVNVGQMLASAGQAEAGLRLQDAAMNQQREMAAMNLLQMISSLSDSRRKESDQRLNQAYALTSLPMDLTTQRLNQILGVLSGTPNPAGIFNQVASLSNLTQNQRAYNDAGEAGWMSGLGQLIGYLAGRGGGAPAIPGLPPVVAGIPNMPTIPLPQMP